MDKEQGSESSEAREENNYIVELSTTLKLALNGLYVRHQDPEILSLAAFAATIQDLSSRQAERFGPMPETKTEPETVSDTRH